ncbi:MAG: penicillin-binding protein 2 [Epsilonproteobacteria bacterium]|nr:penicillin-binding protein 2 [Campylobacterota bacterium]
MKNLRIPAIFFLFFFFILITYGAFLFLSIAKPRGYLEPKRYIKESAIRGKIFTKDYNIAKSEKEFAFYIYPRFIDKNKKELFINLVSIYSGIDKRKIKKALNSGKSRILLGKVDLKTKQNLIYLKKVLDLKRVFVAIRGIRMGYDIVSVDFKRLYPYGDILQPFLGRYRSDKKAGENGLEDYYNEVLKAKKDGYISGYRDVYGNIIFDKDAIIKRPLNGSDLKLNIDLVLQRKIEKFLDYQKSKFMAKEVIAAVMDSKSGKLLAIATSNRYNPDHIRKQDVKNMKISAIRELFEPGSVMKPITFAILLEHRKVNPYEVLKGYNGKWKPKWRKTPIRDDDPFEWISAQNVIVYSSNIGITQLALRLSAKEFYNGLKNFGFAKYSGIDLPYELKGSIRPIRLLNYPVYVSTTSYGYGILVNFVQLLKAYNVFNNNGVAITPRLADVNAQTKRVISPKNAQIMLNILREVVLKGTGVKAKIDGLFTAGKTGTAHVSFGGEGYKRIYNSSFFGFVNDKKHKYTIGVTFFDIKAKWPNYFASASAVPTFKKIVDFMLEENLLEVKNANR